MGMFTDMEAYKSGALDNYIWAQTEFGATIEIPWIQQAQILVGNV